jgi:hypothetical protein
MRKMITTDERSHEFRLWIGLPLFSYKRASKVEGQSLTDPKFTMNYPPAQCADDCMFPTDQWQLRVPAIESLCMSFSIPLSALKELCKLENTVPNSFELFRKRKDGYLKSGDRMELTADNLSAEWKDEVSRRIFANAHQH